MATIKTQLCAGRKPAVQVLDNTPARVREAIALSTANNATGNVVQLAVLPAGTVPSAYTFDLDALAASGMVIDFGILAQGATASAGSANGQQGTVISTAAIDGGNKWVAGSTAGVAGGIVLHTASKAAYDVLMAVTPVEYDRIIAAVITTGGTTPALGNISADVSYQQARP